MQSVRLREVAVVCYEYVSTPREGYSRAVQSYKTAPCETCHEVTTRRNRPDRPHRCIECAVAASASGSEQMAAKSGPVYEKWKARMARWAEREGVVVRPPPRGQ